MIGNVVTFGFSGGVDAIATLGFGIAVPNQDPHPYRPRRGEQADTLSRRVFSADSHSRRIEPSETVHRRIEEPQ